MTKFHYKAEEVPISTTGKRTRVIWRSIVPVILMKGKKLVGLEALIDSGADYNIFHGGVAEVLGIKLTTGKKRKILGITGEPIRGYIHDVEIKPVGMASFKAPIVFSNQLSSHSLAVLGNTRFFYKFKITFNYKNKVIEIL